MRIFSIKYTSSFDKIVNIRKNLNLKMCYRKKIKFFKNTEYLLQIPWVID